MVGWIEILGDYSTNSEAAMLVEPLVSFVMIANKHKEYATIVAPGA